MTNISQYELRQGGRVCLFDDSQGVKKECQEVGLHVEVLKDRRFKIQVDGHTPKIYSPPDCNGYMDDYYCSFPIKPRAVERDTDPWWCKLRLKRVCEGKDKERVVYTKTETEVRELVIIGNTSDKADSPRNIVFIDDTKGNKQPVRVEVKVENIPPEKVKTETRLRVISKEPSRYKPKELNEKVLISYPTTRRVIASVAPGDEFAKGALTIEAVRLVKIATKNNVQPAGPENKAYTDAWIAKKINAKYQEMKKRFR